MIVTGSGVIGLVMVKTCSWCMKAMRVSFYLFLVLIS